MTQRRFWISVAIISFSLFIATESFAKEKPRMGVLRFSNNTGAGWWGGSTGRDLQDMLVAELATKKCFSVLERKELDAVMKEQNLGASGRVSKNTRAKIGNLTGAKYLVAATVSSYEQSSSGGGGGISFKGISVGGKRDRAYIAVDLKVIDVDTGEIADVRTIEATSKSGGLNLGLSKGFFSGKLGQYKKTPAGKAIRACIMEIADYLECSLVKGKHHKCMADFDAKESKRREKTKGSIDLE
ncbi:MAG: penicillin-binding protein activator LpoB [Deltaproteobacteria bacterium]|nr:MAG: penicillin-binding protein activator LpoB [Deltaproteobacteria bacterium]